MIRHKDSSDSEQRAKRILSRRTLLTWSGITMLAGLTGCARRSSLGNETDTTSTSSTPIPASVIRDIGFNGPNLAVRLKSDHNVERLNLVGPDGSIFNQTSITEGATRAELQILFKTGGSYTAGKHDLVAVKGEVSESIPIELSPEINVTDVRPEVDDDGNSTGRLFVVVENAGTGPTWIYNIGFRNAPYRNAPEVIEGDDVADTTFERPANPQDEFLTPRAEQVFLKRRGVLVVSDSDNVSCENGTAEVTVVVQTPHGDIEQPIRAELSGGYHIDDQAAIQHPCKNVEIELLSGGEEDE